MKIRFGRMCRGNGVAYIEVIVTGCCTDQHVEFSACSECGASLPIESYRVTDRDNGSRTYIIATPLLDTRSIKILAELTDYRSQVLSSKTKSINRTVLKWLSRLNYRLDFERTSLIRDQELITYSNQIHIHETVATVAQETGELIVKGFACAPEATDRISFELLSGDGTVVSSPNITLGRTASSTAFGLKRQEVSFTLRVPNTNETWCLVAKGSDSDRSGFLCLDGASKKYYLGTSGAQYFNVLSESNYSFAAKSRIRHIDSLCQRDYCDVNGPLFSIVVPLYNTPVTFLLALVESVVTQLYQHWELILVNSSPENKGLSAKLAEIAERDTRIKVIELPRNLGISGNTNKGVEAASGEYIVFADHDDELDRMALLEYAYRISADPDIDALYSDEDLIREDGEYVLPHLKSAFNIDLLRCHNYITHLVAVKSVIAKRIPLQSRFDGAQDYDFLLRLSEVTNNIIHVPEVLYHWRMCETSTASNAGNKTYADEAGKNALQEHLDRLGLAGSACFTEVPFVYRVRYEISHSPRVSILIPNKDNVDVLRRCIDSLFKKTFYDNFEIVIVENNSSDQETFNYYEQLVKTHDNLRVVTWNGSFNYSAINNFGVTHTRGEYLLFLNNDTEVISGDWLEEMLAYAQREDVGAVGAKLLYPDNTIQHAGVMLMPSLSLGDMGGPMHVFNHLDRSDNGYMNRASRPQDLSAVTAACMLVKRSVFEGVNGFDESFAVAYNDIDLCLRIRSNGHLVVYNPYAVLYHYESVSRGFDTKGQKRQRFISEQGRMRERWSNYYAYGDPYYPAQAMNAPL